ncbi:MAG: hypothetical protein R2836_02930 [Chitinophagales bacterium]|nr:outer membrane beta-barrel protein [Bacteroidota bacterium]MCB9225999.1 outer membrane beta-barrel protein [Chitinophagales bacterium]
MNTLKKSIVLLLFSVLCFSQLLAQDSLATKKKQRDIPLRSQGGYFSLGVRSTISSFSHGNMKGVGIGAGGHFRLQLIDRLNTEWFADVFSNNIDNKAHRFDYHIGWSVMFYLLNPNEFNRKFTPYIMAGHCFDLSVVKINGENGQKASRFSSAVQAGVGCSYNINPKFDITLSTQYMLHLGEELDVHEHSDGSMFIESHKHAGWEGHLLVSLSVNYKIVKLWKRERKQM